MTCIVALRHDDKVYVGGDSAAVSGWDVSERADSKVFWNKEFLIGFAGSYRFGQIMQYHFSPPSDDGMASYTLKHYPMKYMCVYFIPALRACLKENGFLKSENEQEGTGNGYCIVAHGTGMFRIDSDFQVAVPADPFMAIGSGNDLALGALYATSRKRDPRKRLLLALEASAKFNIGVRGPFVIDYTNFT